MGLVQAANRMIQGSSVNVLDYIPETEHAAIFDRTSLYDFIPALKAARDDLPFGGTIEIPDGRFAYETKFSFANGITIKGLSPNAELYCTDSNGEIGTPETPPTLQALTTNALKDQLLVTLPTGQGANFAVDDILVIESEAVVMGVGTGTPGEARELHKVVDIQGDVLQIESPLIFDYLTADNAVFGNFSDVSIKHVGFENLTLSWATPTTEPCRAPDFRFCEDVRVRNIRVKAPSGGPLSFTECYNVFINDILIERKARDDTPWGYGLILNGSCAYVKIDGLIGHDQRHLFTTLSYQTESPTRYRGFPRDVIVSNGLGTTSEVLANYLAIWDTHEFGYRIKFVNCRGIKETSSAACWQLRAPKTTLVNCDAFGGFRNVDIRSTSYDMEVRGGTFEQASNEAFTTNGTSDSVVILDGISVLNAGQGASSNPGRGIDTTSGGGGPRRVIVRNAYIYNCLADPVRDQTLGKLELQGVTIEKGPAGANNALVSIDGGTKVQGCNIVGFADLLTAFLSENQVPGAYGNYFDGKPIQNGIFAYATGPNVVDGGLCNGAIFTNGGATGGIEYDLKTAVEGREHAFQRVASHNLDIDPDGSELFRGQGAGLRLRLLTDGARANIWCTEAGIWDYIVFVGGAVGTAGVNYSFV